MADVQTHEFQAETRQVLHLMIHSLYSNKEIFLRELISNASDAIDKLRFEALNNEGLLADGADYEIHVETDGDAKTVTLRDNGIGMTRDEVIENLGTIARSGTKKFLEALSGEQKTDANLIGQFGVGFYSAFIVASEVTVETRKAGTDQGTRWVSDGEGSYTVAEIDKPTRGTTITLKLRDDEGEFADDTRLRHILKKYSDHIATPIKMVKPADDDDAAATEWETVNQAAALWTRPKGDLSDDDYTGFYKTIAHDWEDPMAWAHNRVEGALDYTSLVYLPTRAPFDLWDRDQAHGLKLYVKRVFIMDDAKTLLPTYLRFVKGVVDTADLPLNVSRELLQDNRVAAKLRAALTKRVHGMIKGLSDDDYKTFWDTFGPVFKEGFVEPENDKEKLAELSRFATTSEDFTTLDAYIERMAAKDESKQEKIYYITAENAATARNSPHIEGFKKRGIEVILLTDRVDEWVVTHLTEYKGKELVSVARGQADLDSIIADPKQEAEQARVEELYKDTLEKLSKVLEEKVETVRVSQRLTESPACLVVGEHAMSRHLEQMLKASGDGAMAGMPGSKPALEVNPEHPILDKLKATMGDDDFADLGQMLYEQAVLAEGSQLDDPAAFVKRLNRWAFGGPGDTGEQASSIITS